jgi:hypothetical protein
VGNAEKPGLDTGLALKGIEYLPDSNENLLQQVFRNTLIGDESQDIAINITVKPMIKFSEGILVTGYYQLDDLVVPKRR